MKIKAVIIDDEQGCRETLDLLLKRNFDYIDIVDHANSAAEGMKSIMEHQPDLVFLDIEMPEKNGFDMLMSIGNINFEVIFVTAYNQYALKAIKFCALDYILKPVDELDLIKAVERAKDKINIGVENEQLKLLLNNTQNDKPKTIALPTAEKIEFVSVNDIIRCKGENNYTSIILTSGKSILISKTLKEYDTLLSDYGFLRIHQSHLVNSRHIKAYFKNDGGYLEMKDGEKVSISRTKKDTVLEFLKSMGY